ncbi:sulfotransferase domain-containing protein [Sulfitobacter sediminilitoris]|uniref:sulfotransferase domain-containing protein n=1 Tax=Sulfitobacter sediminilitoris TaxID=2698830 RepID=UPI0036181F6A
MHRGELTDAGSDYLTVASIAHHFLQSKARQAGGNVHFFHYADLSRDLRGQIERIAGILDIHLSSQILDDIAEANTFASMRKAVEISEMRFHESSPFNDQANFFASGTSNKWEGKLSETDIDRYSDRLASLLSPEDEAWLNWGQSA